MIVCYLTAGQLIRSRYQLFLPILGARFLQEALPRGLVLRLCPLLLVIGSWQLFDAKCCDLTRDNTTKSGAF